MPLGSSSAAPVTTPGPTSRASCWTARRPRSRMECGALPARMCEFQAMTKTLRRKVARSVAGESEGFGDRRAEEPVPEGVEHERQRAFRDVVLLMPDGELRDEIADRIE